MAPEVYGGLPPEAAAVVGETCPARDRMEAALLDAAIEQNLPVLGICRGIQVMNAALGARYGRICRRSARATSSIAGMRPMTCRCIRWRPWRERPWPRSSARGSTR